MFYVYQCCLKAIGRNQKFQCFGSGSGRIRIILSDPDPDPDPYQEALIWIRVAPKDYSGKKSIFFKKF